MTKKRRKSEQEGPKEDVISDEELFARIRGDLPPRGGICPSYGPKPLWLKSIEGYGKDVPNLEDPPKWGIRMWQSVAKEPRNSGGDW